MNCKHVSPGLCARERRSVARAGISMTKILVFRSRLIKSPGPRQTKGARAGAKAGSWPHYTRSRRRSSFWVRGAGTYFIDE